MQAAGIKPLSGARSALFLLLAINLFNYIDRQVLAALEPDIRATFFAADDVHAMTKTGLLGDAFFVTYMISAPILGLLADRFSRWIIVGSAVILWSVASGASGLAATFGILFATRIFVGIGEGGYGPAAPTILSDLFPIETRGRIMAIFCSAIPVGSALGYVIGGLIGAHFGWRWAFYLVAPPGLLLGLLCFWQRDPRVAAERSGAEITAPQRTRLFEPVPHTFLSHQLHRDDIDDFCNGRFGFLGTGVFALSRSKSCRGHDDLWPDHGSRGPGLDASGRRYCRQVALTSSRFVFLGLWNRNAHRVSSFRCHSLHSVSRSVDPDVPGDLLPVFKHRSVKHGSRECFAAGRPRDSVCCKHFRHPCVRGCTSVLAARLHWRPREYACGVSVCVRNYLRFGGHMALRSEISSSRYSRRRRQNHIVPIWGAKKPGVHVPG